MMYFKLHRAGKMQAVLRTSADARRGLHMPNHRLPLCSNRPRELLFNIRAGTAPIALGIVVLTGAM